MKYIFHEKENYVEIVINDQVGKIDLEDLHYLNEHNDWFIHQGYLYTREFNNLTPLHRIIYKPFLKTKNSVIDHINRDRLDNRKSNLREASRSINSTNAKVRSDKTQLDLPRGIVYRAEDKTPRADGRGQKRYESFEVQWSIEGKRRSKTFSIKKYGGYNKALEKAKEFRKVKLQELGIEDIV